MDRPFLGSSRQRILFVVSIIYSNQDRAAKDIFPTALKEKLSTLRLLLCTSKIGMGFNPPGIEGVVHAAQPRNLTISNRLVEQIANLPGI